ncbi:MAG: rhodanese-related sulfurtransferase [Bosea sp. (in: a-proteobacteria)]
MSVHVAALYRFARFADPASLVGPLQQACEAEGVKGTLLVAQEGINGTIAGSDAGLGHAVDAICHITGLDDLEIKYSQTAEMPFLRMKVKLKREIVTIGDEAVDPLLAVGTYVEAKDWNALIADPDVLLIDVRNDYEYRIGTFQGAVDPKTASFRDFPAYVRAELGGAKGRKIAMFCTGGIRCEKASAFMLQEGFGEVHHLKGGILRYLEDVPEYQSLWQGGCFVFDERVAVRHGMVPDGRYTLCHGCRQPLSAEDCLDPAHEDGVVCRHCAPLVTPTQRASARERHRQMLLAKERGTPHIGPDAQPKDQIA